VQGSKRFVLISQSFVDQLLNQAWARTAIVNGLFWFAERMASEGISRFRIETGGEISAEMGIL
jgi:hypothetical protein